MRRMRYMGWSMDWNLSIDVKMRMGMSACPGVLLLLCMYTAGDTDGRSCYRSHPAELAWQFSAG